MSIDKKCVR